MNHHFMLIHRVLSTIFKNFRKSDWLSRGLVTRKDWLFTENKNPGMVYRSSFFLPCSVFVMSMFIIFSYKDKRNTNKKSTMIQTVDDFRTIITSFTDKNWNPIKSPTDKNTTCQQRLARNLWKIWKWISLSFHKWAREKNDFFLGFPRLSVGFPGNIWTLLHWWLSRHR